MTMLTLNSIYDKICQKLVSWENHRWVLMNFLSWEKITHLLGMLKKRENRFCWRTSTISSWLQTSTSSWTPISTETTTNSTNPSTQFLSPSQLWTWLKRTCTHSSSTSWTDSRWPGIAVASSRPTGTSTKRRKGTKWEESGQEKRQSRMLIAILVMEMWFRILQVITYKILHIGIAPTTTWHGNHSTNCVKRKIQIWDVQIWSTLTIFVTHTL